MSGFQFTAQLRRSWTFDINNWTDSKLSWIKSRKYNNIIL